MTAKNTGLKFVDKYKVKTYQAYEADPDDVIIAGPDHALYDPDGNKTHDPVRVKSIDEAGAFNGTILVWSDPDRNQLYAIDGRGNILDVREVNRIRRREERKPILIRFIRFNGSLDEAVDMVAMKNFRRKRPSPSHTAREIVRYHRLGRDWGRIAEILQLDGEDERALRARAPLAYCVAEVAAAFDAGEFPMRKAKLFGGKKLDGSERLGRGEQLALLEEMRGEKKSESSEAVAAGPIQRPLPAKARERLRSALSNGEVSKLKAVDQVAARVALAYDHFLRTGDASPLDKWPGFAELARGAIAKPAVVEKE